jgi:hypothetical protein
VVMVEEFMVLLVWFLCNQDPQTIHRPVNLEGSHAIRSGPLAPVHCRGAPGGGGGESPPLGGGRHKAEACKQRCRQRTVTLDPEKRGRSTQAGTVRSFGFPKY